VLRDSVRHTKTGLAMHSVADRIQQARRVPADIRRAREWAEALVPADHPRPQEDLHVRAAQHDVQASHLFREKKKAQ